jgi:hypothetical protein
LPYQELNAARLAGAIQGALACDKTRLRAARLGARLREEDGVGRAVEVVHKYFPALERHVPGCAVRARTRSLTGVGHGGLR